MPWKEASVPDQRLLLVSAVLSGDYSVAEACRRFNVSRPTAYKWLLRHAKGEGFDDRGSAPVHHPNATPEPIVQLVLGAREAHPRWGPRKLKVWLARQYPDRAIPASSTIGEILRRHHLVASRRRRPKAPPYTSPFMEVRDPNDLWTIDFKGDIRLRDGSYLKPLTVVDASSRYILHCDALPNTRGPAVAAVMRQLFRRHGLPRAIRSDNGPPFAARGLIGLSSLSASWVRLGIVHERIEPGKPQQNGRHERMHAALKREAVGELASLTEQRRALRRFQRIYNEERPHQALGDQVPAELYRASLRQMPDRLPELAYPRGWDVRKLDISGKLYWRNRKMPCTKALAGEHVGLEPIAENISRLWYAGMLLAVVDGLMGTIHPARDEWLKCKQGARSVL